MSQVQVGGEHWERGGRSDQTQSAALQIFLLNRRKWFHRLDKTFLVCVSSVYKKPTKTGAKMEFWILTLQEHPVGQVGARWQEI